MAKTIQQLRDAHACISRKIRFQAAGTPIAEALKDMRDTIDEVSEYREAVGPLKISDNLKKP